MEPNENQLSSYYHHHHHQSPTAGAGVSPTNGLLPCSHSGDGASHMVYPHSVSSSAVTSPLEPAKRKRGRPRKYGTPEQALAAKKAATSSSHASPKEKKDHGAAAAASPSYSGSASKKSQLASFGVLFCSRNFVPFVLFFFVPLFLVSISRESCVTLLLAFSGEFCVSWSFAFKFLVWSSRKLVEFVLFGCPIRFVTVFPANLP